MASATNRAPNSQAAQVSYTENAQPTAHNEEQKGHEDRTLVGSTIARSFDDTTGFTSEGRVITAKYDIPEEDEQAFTDVHPTEENVHTIEAILSRTVKLTTLEFKTSLLAGKLIGDPIDVMQTIKTSPGFALARSKLTNFYGIRFTAKLKITLNPQPFESGMFQIYFVPVVRTFPPIVDATSTAIKDECKLPFTTSCPNILCNISTQSEVELVIPYTGSSPYIPLSSPNADFGAFYVQSVVPITDSTNNAACDLSIYMSLHDVILFGATSGDFPSSTGAVPQMLQPPSNECDMKSSGPISKIGRKLLPLLDELGLSAPVSNPNPERVTVNPFANLAHSNSNKNAFKLSLLSTHHLMQGNIGIDKRDEMDINYLMSKPTYYNQFSWKTTDVENSVLQAYPVEPNCRLNQSTTADFIINAPNRLRYVANCFKYWRGSIKFYFHVVANKFHSGRLRFVYDCGSSGTGAALSDFPETFTHVIDIRDAVNFVLECPYFGIAPWRRVPHDYNRTGLTYDHTSTEKSSNFYDPVNTLRVYVENQLRAPATATSQSIQIVCMTAAGTDFEFAAPIAPFSVPTTTYVQPNKRDNVDEVVGAIQLISRPEILVPEKSGTLIHPPSRDYEADTLIAKRMGVDATPEHMRRWNEDRFGPTHLGPYAYVPEDKVEEFNIRFPNFSRFYKARQLLQSSTGARPQALDYVPINMVSSSQSLNTAIPPHPITVGEKITSVRQLIKRYQQLTSASTTITTTITPSFILCPYYLAQPADDSSMSTDYYSYFNFLYRFYRGSIRFMIVCSDSGMNSIVKFDPSYKVEVAIKDSQIFSYRLGLYEVKEYPASINFSNLKTSTVQPFDFNLQGAVELEIPYYSRFTKLGVRSYTDRNPTAYFQDMDMDYVPSGQVFLSLVKYVSANYSANFSVYRAAADDFNLGYILGPPLCRVNPTLT